MFALRAIQTRHATEEKRAWWALSTLSHWPPSQLKILHQRQFLATQISGYGTLALDMPRLKPGKPVSTHTVSGKSQNYIVLFVVKPAA